MSIPESLLKSTIEDKINYFYHYTMAHPVLLKADLEIRKRLSMKSAEPIIFVVGPTGGGKTTMSKRIQQQLLAASLSAMKEDQDFLPTAWFEMPAYGKKPFKWSAVYIEILKALENPLAAKRIRNDPKGPDAIPKETRNEYNLRIAVEETIVHRKTKSLMFDEANHLTKVSGATAFYDQIEIIKSLANRSECIIILFGTYELFNLLNLSGQLARRSRVVHLRRYDYKLSGDEQHFKDILRTFQQKLPLEVEPALEKHWEFIWIRCGGLIGILKPWLDHCLQEVLEDKHKTITFEILKKNALPVGRIKKILDEILINEQMLRDELSDDYSSIATDMGFVLDKNGNPIRYTDSKKVTAKPPKGRQRPFVGERNPVRDTVGEAVGSTAA